MNAEPLSDPSGYELLSVVGRVETRPGAAAEPVFNLEIDGQHEYFANGILVHNCQWNPLVDSCSPDRLDAPSSGS